MGACVISYQQWGIHPKWKFTSRLQYASNSAINGPIIFNNLCPRIPCILKDFNFTQRQQQHQLKATETPYANWKFRTDSLPRFSSSFLSLSHVFLSHFPIVLTKKLKTYTDHIFHSKSKQEKKKSFVTRVSQFLSRSRTVCIVS